MYQVLLGFFAVVANADFAVEHGFTEPWPDAATTDLQSSAHVLHGPQDYLLEIVYDLRRTEVESAHRGTFPVPLRAGHIKDQPSLERLGHDALFGTNSRFFMYQVLLGFFAVVANADFAVEHGFTEPWPDAATTDLQSSAHVLHGPQDYLLEIVYDLRRTEVESAHRGTFPVPLRAGHIKDQPSLERLGHDALFGTNSRFFMYQVLLGFFAVVANADFAVEHGFTEPWPDAATTDLQSSAHVLHGPQDYLLEIVYDLRRTEVESAHRGTFPVPLRAGHIKDQPSLERLGHDALFGTNSRFFMYQVSYLNGTKCYRSSNVMLLRVSCPISKRQMIECLEHASLCFVDALLFSLYDGCLTLSQILLLLSGDVELNPGPMNAVERDQMTNIERILLEMKTGQETVLAKLTEITTRQCELESKITGLIEKTNNVESRIARVEKMEDKFMAKLDDLENRSRRQNLVFFGLPDREHNETWEASEKLSGICKDVMKLDDISVERAHRVGVFREGKNRPIVACFSRWKARENVFKNACRLKGTSYSISEDFSRAVQEKRRQLWNYAKEKRENKENRVRLSYDKLIINGQTFVWDSDMRMPVPLQAHARLDRGK
ncbi:uncharacterized protein [Dermacentor andersoni]|uniref:uncharacterized protein n=1 Tax=Dermacentor andersoni TaxID=34620 RepID=UPI0021559097|nr:uncharacterized protein LOC126540294 [Dermacentor andersoni]